MTQTAGWFDVDREGMRRVLERRGKSAALLELVQNGWDEEGVARVGVFLDPTPGQPTAFFQVTDDAPEGFSDLAYAYTMFKPSAKAKNPEQRGRFSIGEKLVLSLCEWATVSSTKGTVEFKADGSRVNRPRKKMAAGSIVEGTIRMTRAEVAETIAKLHMLISPEGIETMINDEPLFRPVKVGTFRCVLKTEIADDDGYLRESFRMTDVDVYEPYPEHPAMLYEMGIPVMETGDRWHLDVRQKIPVSLDRAALVSEAYLRDLRAETLNAMADHLTAADSSETWVTDALDDPLVTEKAVTKALDLRFGEKRVVYDPSDLEANRIAASQGYTVIAGRSLSKDAWANVKRHEAALPAGQVTPSPKPYHPDGEELRTIPEDEWTDDHTRLAAYAIALHARVVGGGPLHVTLANDAGWGFNGTYGSRRLTINVATVRGRGPCYEVDRFLIHEFAHSRGGHLEHAFDDALAEIGAKMVELAREEPDFFETFQPTSVIGSAS